MTMIEPSGAVKGLFVVFEGGDRVGKSTQVQALAAALTASDVEHVVTFQPGDTREGAIIRRLLLDPGNHLDERCEALLYAADKAQHVRYVVQPALAAGKVVICDRYVDSMLAAQGAGRALQVADLAAIAGWATRGLRPDLTVLLDTDPAKAVGRVADQDRLEQAGSDFHARVREGFRELAAVEPQRYLVLPGLVSLRATAARIRAAVGALLGRELTEPQLIELGEQSESVADSRGLR